MDDITNLLDQNGELVGVSPDQVQIALEQGFTEPTQAHIDQYKKEQAYGTPGQQAATFAEGAIKSVPVLGGLALKGIQGLGITTPEATEARQEVNPVASTIGNITGTTLGILGAPEGEILGAMDIANPIGAIVKVGRATENALASRIAGEGAKTIAQKVLTKVVSAGAAGAVEGAAFTAGGVANDMILGDPHLTGQQAFSEIATGALLGGGASAFLGGVGIGAGIAKDRFFPGSSSELAQGAVSDTIKENAAKETRIPRSAADVAEMVRNPPEGLKIEGLPQKAELRDAEKFIPDSQFPVHEGQYHSLTDKMARRDWQIFLEDSKDADAANFRSYEAYQKQEARDLLNDTIQKTSPMAPVTEDVVKGGQKLVDSLHAQYQTEKKELAPLFKKFDKAALSPVTYPGDLVGRMEEAIPGMSEHISYNGVDGRVDLSRYKPTMGISKEAYGAVKDLVGAINDEGLTINDIRNVRESMRDRLNLLSSPRDQMQIGGLRKSLMDFMETEVGKVSPDLAVRDTFKRYAVNEQNREVIERILGGKIGDRVSFAKTIKMEDVLDHVFSNTETVKASRAILGGNFNEAIGNYLSKQVAAVTDNTKNGFSSNKFGTFLKSKNPELAEAFSASPETLSRLSALTKKMQILPDAPPVNPSQSATTIMSVLGGVNKFRALFNWKGEIASAAMKMFEGASSDAKNRLVRDLIMAGKSGEEAALEANKRAMGYGVLKALGESVDKAQKKILSGAASIFSERGSDIGGVIGSEAARTRAEVQKHREESIKDFEKRTHKISTMVQNPDVMLNHLQEATSHLYDHAPNVTAQIQKTAATAMNFLASKVPHPIDQKPLSPPWKPNPTEIAAFNHYYDVVSKPSSVFKMIKTGMLTPLAVEAIATVYPDYYQAAKSALLDKMAEQKERIPYRTRMMLSLFSGVDLDSSTTPKSMALNQMIHQGPSQQSQNQMPAQGVTKASQKGLSGLSDISGRTMGGMNKVASRER